MSGSKYILFDKCIDMMNYAYDAMRDIPKDHRYALGADIRSSMGVLLRLIVRCGKKYYKKTTLQELDIEHETLKGLFLLAVRLMAINIKEYGILSQHMEELGKMIGGWIKNAPR